MIENFSDIEEFKKKIKESDKEINIDNLLNLDLPYLEKHESSTIILLPTFDADNWKDILFLSKNENIVLSKEKLNNNDKKIEKILKKPFGESTYVTFLSFKSILKKYSREFEFLRSRMNQLDLNPVSEDIENTGRQLRLLTDRIEGLVHIIMTLKEKELEEVNIELIQFEYDFIMTKSRYELERCRSHMYRVASLRTKAEMKSSSDLNTTMKRLTVIMTFLTIVSIVVSVPGTIGAILGIPALSNAYFENYTETLVWVLISLTLISIGLGYVYWKSLKMS